MIKQKTNYWRIVAIIFLILVVALLIKGEIDKKGINEGLIYCNAKLDLCIDSFNGTLSAWKSCIYELGNVSGLSDEEIRSKLGLDGAYLNEGRLIK